MNELVKLKPPQIIFAEWLATSPVDRSPKTQQELAVQLNVTEATLCNWKKIPELWEYIQGLYREQGRGNVATALRVEQKVMEEYLRRDTNPKVAIDASKDTLSRWSDPRREAHISVTLKELYQEYDKKQQGE